MNERYSISHTSSIFGCAAVALIISSQVSLHKIILPDKYPANIALFDMSSTHKVRM